MSDWTHRVVVAAPLALLDLSSAIGRAMDPDAGGARSFETLRAGAGATITHAVCDSIVRGDTAAGYALMLTQPAMLHAAVQADYAKRWPSLTPPTLPECEQWIDQSLIVVEPVGRSLALVLAGWGLALSLPGVA